MAFRDNVAPKRVNPIADSIQGSVPNQDSSTQTKTASQDSKFRSVSVQTDKYNVGNHVRLQANSKGTGVVGRPTSIALESEKSADSAVVNPDGSKNRPGSF